jgi:hypothetical protein
MTFKFPWDENTGHVRTRLVEDPDHGYIFEFEGDNEVADEYRQLRRLDGSKGFGASKEWREVAFVSNEEILFLRKLTGIDLAQGGPEHTEAFLKLIRSGDFSRLKTIDGMTTTKAFK